MAAPGRHRDASKPPRSNPRPASVRSSRAPRSRTDNTSCAELQHFIARQKPIPLSRALAGSATSVWAPRSNPQPHSISEGSLTNEFPMLGRPLFGTGAPTPAPRDDRPYLTRTSKPPNNSTFRALSNRGALSRIRPFRCWRPEPPRHVLATTANAAAKRPGWLRSPFRTAGLVTAKSARSRPAPNTTEARKSAIAGTSGVAAVNPRSPAAS